MSKSKKELPPPALPDPGNGELIITQPLVSTTRGELYVAPGAHPSSYPTNLPDSAWGKSVRVNVENTSEYQPDKFGVVLIPATYFLVHPAVQVNEETGEVTDAIRTVFIDADGRHMGCTSEVVRKRLYSLIGHYGPGPWSPPVNVRIARRQNKSGTRSYFELSVLLGD